MDATEFFQKIIKPNYEDAVRAPDDLRLLLNAIISMNTVAEFVALDRLGYAKISQQELAKRANDIRRQFPSLEDLKFCAETLKHVRKLSNTMTSDFSVTPSSTSISPSQPSTWIIETTYKTYYLKTVADEAFRTIQMLPEFTRHRNSEDL
jgi:hypothetical protein